MLSCVLNIIIAVTGFIDTLLKFTVIWIIPSKIGGAIIGFLEAWVYIFLVVFILGQIRVTSSWVDDSKIGDFILNHTPVMNTILGDARDAANEIYAIVKDVEGSSDEEKRDINISILQIEMKYNLITKEVISLEKSLSSETTAFAIDITPVTINIIGTSIFAILNKIAINFNTLTTFSFVQEKASKPSLANI